MLFFVGARLTKALAFGLVPPIIAALTTRPTDIVQIVTISVLCTLLACAAFVNSYVNFESRFVQWFSHLTSSPRWFTIWLLVMVLWIPVRHLLIEHGMLSNDTDFVVATILWSCVPYMVENVLKSTSAKAMAAMTELIIEVQRSQKRSEEKDSLILELLQQLHDKDELMVKLLDRLLDAIEVKEGGEAV